MADSSKYRCIISSFDDDRSEEDERTNRKRETNCFLKEHESKMTEYINQYKGEKVTEINYDWNNVNRVVIGNSLPSGAGKKFKFLDL
ncbi:hypothetical protein SNF32_15245 [Enterococcus mundtii]|nr:hypothetical protein [Enterococcus mundtii]